MRFPEICGSSSCTFGRTPGLSKEAEQAFFQHRAGYSAGERVSDKCALWNPGRQHRSKLGGETSFLHYNFQCSTATNTSHTQNIVNILVTETKDC